MSFRLLAIAAILVLLCSTKAYNNFLMILNDHGPIHIAIPICTSFARILNSNALIKAFFIINNLEFQISSR